MDESGASRFTVSLAHRQARDRGFVELNAEGRGGACDAPSHVSRAADDRVLILMCHEILAESIDACVTAAIVPLKAAVTTERTTSPSQIQFIE